MHRNSATKPLQKVPGHSHLFRRGAQYYFRLGIPENLRPIIGMRELVKSLKTSDYRLAVERVSVEECTARGILQGARARLEARQLPEKESKEAESLVLVSEKHAQELARKWFVELERGAADRWRETRQRFSREDLAELSADLAFQQFAITGESERVAPENFNDGTREVRAFLQIHNFCIDEQGEDFSTLARYFREARLEHVRRHQNRVQDQPIEPHATLFRDLDENTPPITIQKGITIGQLSTQFQSEFEKAGKAPKTLLQYQVTARLLNDVFGESRVASSLTRSDAERFCELIETLPGQRTKRYAGLTVEETIAEAVKRGDESRLAPNTRRNRFFSAVTLFKYGVDTKKLSDNPFDDRLLKQRFTPKDSESNERKNASFQIEQLRKIFAAPLYTGCQDDERGYAKKGPSVIRRGRFWVPLIALFQGMRENEICQLHTTDVLGWSDGLYIEICAGEGKRLKNKPSKRTVPIHPELLKMGFTEYVAERRADTISNALFPELSRAKTGSFSDNFSKWFSNFLGHVFCGKIDQSFHSFRHTFTDGCRTADLSPQRIDRLCGWAGEGRQQRDYGRDKLIAVLWEDLSKVSFPSLDLSHLYVRL